MQALPPALPLRQTGVAPVVPALLPPAIQSQGQIEAQPTVAVGPFSRPAQASRQATALGLPSDFGAALPSSGPDIMAIGLAALTPPPQADDLTTLPLPLPATRAGAPAALAERDQTSAPTIDLAFAADPQSTAEPEAGSFSIAWTALRDPGQIAATPGLAITEATQSRTALPIPDAPDGVPATVRLSALGSDISTAATAGPPTWQSRAPISRQIASFALEKAGAPDAVIALTPQTTQPSVRVSRRDPDLVPKSREDTQAARIAALVIAAFPDVVPPFRDDEPTDPDGSITEPAQRDAPAEIFAPLLAQVALPDATLTASQPIAVTPPAETEPPLRLASLTAPDATPLPLASLLPARPKNAPVTVTALVPDVVPMPRAADARSSRRRAVPVISARPDITPPTRGDSQPSGDADAATPVEETPPLLAALPTAESPVGPSPAPTPTPTETRSPATVPEENNFVVAIRPVTPDMTPPTRPSDRAAALEVALATPGPNAVLEQAPPPARPEAVATAVPEPKVIRVDPNATENKIEADLTPSRLALGVSGRPSARPKRFAQRVAALQRETPPTAAAVPAATPRATRTSRAPAIPSSASVARAATVKDVFPTRRLALVGVFGASGTREALLRTPSGRFVKVKTGDRVSGYRVSAIGSSAIRLRKGSRDTVLDIPN